MKEIVNEVLNYFSDMKKCCAGRDALNRTSKATGSRVSWRYTVVECYVYIGISKWTIMSIRRETNSGGPDLSTPAKGYKVSRQRVLVGTFICEAIRRRMFKDLLSPSCVGIGDKCRDSDCDNDSSDSVNTEAVAGTFKQH